SAEHDARWNWKQRLHVVVHRPRFVPCNSCAGEGALAKFLKLSARQRRERQHECNAPAGSKIKRLCAYGEQGREIVLSGELAANMDALALCKLAKSLLQVRAHVPERDPRRIADDDVRPSGAEG